MSNDFIQQLMMDAEREIYGGIEKSANDANGKPEPAEEQGGGNEIMSMAQAWIAKVEQLKTQLGAQAAGAAPAAAAAPAQAAPVADPAAQQAPVDPAAAQAAGAAPVVQQAGDGAVVIQTSNGTQIKVAQLRKLAAIYGPSLFRGVQ